LLLSKTVLGSGQLDISPELFSLYFEYNVTTFEYLQRLRDFFTLYFSRCDIPEELEDEDEAIPEEPEVKDEAIPEEPEDEDEALSGATYKKTFKKQQ
jgi:hypothetical protein